MLGLHDRRLIRSQCYLEKQYFRVILKHKPSVNLKQGQAALIKCEKLCSGTGFEIKLFEMSKNPRNGCSSSH